MLASGAGVAVWVAALVRREIRRAAWPLWITPFEAAFAIWRTAAVSSAWSSARRPRQRPRGTSARWCAASRGRARCGRGASGLAGSAFLPSGYSPRCLRKVISIQREGRTQLAPGTAACQRGRGKGNPGGITGFPPACPELVYAPSRVRYRSVAPLSERCSQPIESLYVFRVAPNVSPPGRAGARPNSSFNLRAIHRFSTAPRKIVGKGRERCVNSRTFPAPSLRSRARPFQRAWTRAATCPARAAAPRCGGSAIRTAAAFRAAPLRGVL